MTGSKSRLEEALVELDNDLEPGGLSDKTVKSMAAGLTEAVASRMGATREEVEHRLRSIGLDARLLIAGRTWSDDNWKTFEIRLSRGLLLFHYKFIKLFVSRVAVVGDHREVVDDARVSEETTRKTARQLIEAFWQGESHAIFFRTESLELARLSKSQLELAAHLVHDAGLFVVAHEFAHVLMHICPESVRQERLIVEAAKRSLVQPWMAVQEELPWREVPHDWVEELTADVIGAALCRTLWTNELVRMVVDSSARLSLIMCALIERGYFQKTGRRFEQERHPPSELRLELLERISPWRIEKDLGYAFREFGYHLLEDFGGTEP